MLTEVDTRSTPSGEVSLFMDTDAKVYLVCVEGYAPITCLTRDRALCAYRHPFVYIPLESHRIDSNGTGGGSPSQESYQGLSERTAALLVELKETLDEMNDTDFHWSVGIIGDIVRNLGNERMHKPYDHHANDDDIPFV